jgi:UDP:flavonoid glycosyltransferase YjiC (YdhE family)
MRVGLLTHGSRGDVQPFVVLARALAARGARVELAGPPNSQGFVEAAGVRSMVLPIDSHAFIASEEGQRILTRGDVLTFVRELGDALVAEWDAFAERTEELAARSDVLVCNPITFPQVLTLVDPRDTPWAMQLTFPALPTATFASPLMRGAPLPFGWMNRLTHWLAEHAYWRSHTAPSRAWRRRRGMPSLRGRGQAIAREKGVPVLAAWASALSALPADADPNHVQTGDWCAPEDASFDGELDPALDAWLASGPPVVYVGFGSMPIASWPRLFEQLARIAVRSKVRVLVVRGWSAAEPEADLPSDVLRVERAVDHRAVLPRCVAAVHHGGAGTTHAVLRAGLPSVVCPLMIDQFFWGWRVRALGVGTSVRLTELDERSLEQALRYVLREDVRAEAATYRARLPLDGAERAAELVLRLAEARGRTAPLP